MTAKLYESPALRAVTGSAIRPGGFELTRHGVECCRLHRGARVIDIGCGNGATVDYLRRQHGLAAAGLDLSAALLGEGALTYRGAPLVKARAEQIPARDGCFGAVLCECVLSLCPSPQLVLLEAWRVLRPGGYLIVADVYARAGGPAAFTGAPAAACCLQGAVDRQTVESRVAVAGFDLMQWEDHTPLLKQLAARLIWAYGSLPAFWSAAGDPAGCAAGGLQAAAGYGRPGYYLLVAHKPGVP